MNAFRSDKDNKDYDAYLASLKPEDGCQFCAIESGYEQFVTETVHFKIILNIFPYSEWDKQQVTEHLMIIPKLHMETLKSLSAEESKEFIDLISDYEHNGYNIYARAPGSQMRSILHQHTHLIKLKPA